MFCATVSIPDDSILQHVLVCKPCGKESSQILSPWLGDMANSGKGLLYRPARLHRPAGRGDNPIPESTIFLLPRTKNLASEIGVEAGENKARLWLHRKAKYHKSDEKIKKQIVTIVQSTNNASHNNSHRFKLVYKAVIHPAIVLFFLCTRYSNKYSLNLKNVYKADRNARICAFLADYRLGIF